MSDGEEPSGLCVACTGAGETWACRGAHPEWAQQTGLQAFNARAWLYYRTHPLRRDLLYDTRWRTADEAGRPILALNTATISSVVTAVSCTARTFGFVPPSLRSRSAHRASASL